LKIQQYSKDISLFLNKKGDLLFFLNYDLKIKKMRAIPGNFQIARASDDMIAAASFGTIYCYYIKKSLDIQSSSFSVFLYTKFIAHADTVVHLLFLSKHNSPYN
jgi:hypothetical protein